MGKVWGPDAVAKNTSTALYGNIVAVAESPKREGLLYVGTDDGLIQVTEDGGANWRKIDEFPGVPANAYVARISASQHDANTAYAAFEQSPERRLQAVPAQDAPTPGGRGRRSRRPADARLEYAIAEDHVDPNLLFAGTEFAAYFSSTAASTGSRSAAAHHRGARHRDPEARERSGDRHVRPRHLHPRRLHAAALDDADDVAEARPHSSPARDACSIVPTQQYGGRGKAFQGEMLYTADNPPYGAVFTYYLKDGLKTKQKRVDAEKAAEKAGKPIEYPGPRSARRGRRRGADDDPHDQRFGGHTHPHDNGSGRQGLQRVAWDLRLGGHHACTSSRARWRGRGRRRWLRSERSVCGAWPVCGLVASP